MATCQDVLKQAMRGIGILDNARLDAATALEGMIVFNDLFRAMLGNGIGPRLDPVNQSTSTAVRNGTRYMVGAATLTLTLPSNPKDGDRFGFVDSRGALASYPVTINPNGRFLEGVTSSTVANTNNLERTYFYTSHSATWTKERDYTKGMDFPLAAEARRGFTDLLSVALADSNGEAGAVSDNLKARAAIGWASITRLYGQGGTYDPPVPL